MTDTLLIRDAVKELIAEAGTKVYHVGAPDDAIYPYTVFDFKRVTNDVIDRYSLEVDVWDEYSTHSRVDTIMDKIEEQIDRRVECKDIIVVIHKDDVREHVIDENKAIKRTHELFILDVGRRN